MLATVDTGYSNFKKDKMKTQNQKYILKEKAYLPSGRCTYLFQYAVE